MKVKNNFFKIFTFIALFCAINMTTLPTATAQCPMCKMSAESDLKNGGSAGKGLNNGILFMLATPYFLIGIIGYVWYNNRKKEEGEIED